MNLYERTFDGKSLLPMYSKDDSKRIKKLVNVARMKLNTDKFGSLACTCATVLEYSKMNNNIGYLLEANTYTGRNIDDFTISTIWANIDSSDDSMMETNLLYEKLYKVKIGFLKLTNFRSSKRIN